MVHISYTCSHNNTYSNKCEFSCYRSAVMHTWQSQDACALSRHCEPCKKSSWSRARNSQENRLFLTASGVGTRSPTWTIAVSWEKALNLHPSKCQVPNHSWVDWWGWWEADGKIDGNCLSGAWTQDLRPWAKDTTTTPLSHTQTSLLEVKYCQKWNRTQC